MTSREAMQQAFAALLRNDIGERDRLCAEARRAMSVEKLVAEADAVERVMAVDFYVTSGGDIVSTTRMARAAGVLN